jgi:CRISPR system Cascade subunit CasB
MSNSGEIYNFVASKIHWLEREREDGRANSDQIAALAKLRRGVGKEAGTVPEIWPYVYEGFPEELVGKGRLSLYAETAIHTALTLYAVHRQGNKVAHDKKNRSLGKAANELKNVNHTNEQGIKRRFDALATAKTPEEIIYHSRGIIQLLKQSGVTLDYAKFAEDLFFLQCGANLAKKVQRRWGMDFYNNIGKDDADSEENTAKKLKRSVHKGEGNE